MNEVTERLRNLLSDAGEGGSGGSVTERIGELDALEARTDLDRTETDVSTVAALADGTRYRIVRLLAAADDDLCVCEITPLVDVSSSAVSHALADLSDAGLVDRRKDGRWRYYRPTERADALLDALDATSGDR